MNPKWATVVQKDRFDHLLRAHLLRADDERFEAEEGSTPDEEDPDLMYGKAHEDALAEYLDNLYYDDGHLDWLEREAELQWDLTDPRDSIVKAFVVAEMEEDDRRWAGIDLMWEWHDNGYTVSPLFMTRVIGRLALFGTW